MEGDNNSVQVVENKSNSLLWSIVAIVIIVVLGYILLGGESRENKMNNAQESMSQNEQPVDSMGTQSDSTEIESIEADFESTDFNSLEVEIE